MGPAVTHTIFDLPELLQKPVERWFERLQEQAETDDLPDHVGKRAARVVACSEFAGTVLLREWSWFLDNVATFDSAQDGQELQHFVDEVVASELELSEIKRRLRRYRNRYLLRVLWREVHDLADLDETLRALSDLADRLLDAATRIAEQQLQPRFGSVKAVDGSPVPLVILGMGKLGGCELNFSSDIDLIFCFTEDGETDGAKTVSAQEYFTRLSRHIIALVDEVTVDGFVFRIDTRLRPFGDSGPPVVSFAALESYLLQHGRDWERYAYVKARVVGAQPSAQVLQDLNAELIQPFVYRRYLDYGVFESVREMQMMIAAEVRRRELANNVKLGPGGIREAEFIVQALQLVRGGSEPALQSRSLQEVLPKLVSERGLTAEGADELRSAYRYLRRLENFIQAIRDQQTHDLPEDPVDRSRLSFAMGHDTWDDLIAVLDAHREAISSLFAATAFRGDRDDSPENQLFGRLWDSNCSEEEWRAALQDMVGDGAGELATYITGFASTAARKRIDAISSSRLQRFVPGLMSRIVAAKRPRAALRRTLRVVERILRRSAYIALLNENDGALSRLISLCERSQYIATRLARYPALLDELLDPRIYTEAVTKADLVSELRERLRDESDGDSEVRVQAIAQFQRATMFRIAVADFSGKLPIMKVSDGLTWLAEAVLDETLQAAWEDLTRRHGVPQFMQDGVTHEAGFGIVAYGKLGGLELSYGSDLDIVFLHNSTGTQQTTNGEKSIDNILFFGRLVQRLVHFLTTQTGSGELYEVDTRLRPDGRSGLLVTSADAFERYQDENAWTWEHQALLRARAVAGSEDVAAEFERIRSETLIERVNRDKLREDVISMRERMRKKLDNSDGSHFNLKHGRGGIADIEFLVQYLVLRDAGEFDRVIEYSDNIRQIDALMESGSLPASVGEPLQDTYRSYRLYLHHLVLDGRSALCDAKRFEAERQHVSACWDQWLG